MTKFKAYGQKIAGLLSRPEWLLFALGFAYALFWQAITPIQYTGDSETYLGAAHMLLAQSVGMPPIFRPPGYPLLLLLTGAVAPGTFIPLLFLQALFAAAIPVLIYRIVSPEGPRAALVAAIIAILSGTTTVHTSQIMTEPLFMLLLFLGLAIAVKLIRAPDTASKNAYWLAMVFGALNIVRPIGAPMFWAILIVIIAAWRSAGVLPRLWKKAAGAAVLFMALMAVWTIANDVMFSLGARYSPLTAVRVNNHNKLATYLYGIPFNEAYFEPWARRVNNPQADPTTFGSLADRPAMAKIRDIVRQHLSAHPHDLVGNFAGQPGALAYRMFAEPDHVYFNYIRAALEADIASEERLKLYHAAAVEARRDWPTRWIDKIYAAPVALLLGPSHGSGASHFLIAYTSLPQLSLDNGPATKLMFTTLKSVLQNTPKIWDGFDADPLYGKYQGNADGLVKAILTNPNQNYAWFAQVMLWDLMGYDISTELMGKVGYESYSRNRAAYIRRSLEMLLKVAAGPDATIDNVSKGFATVEIYEYLETGQVKPRALAELRATKNRYAAPYTTWQAPTKFLYHVFYLLKPFFLITALIACIVLYAHRRSAVTLVLLVPYGISVIIYGLLFTSMGRYTDPTILIPVIVTCMALPMLKTAR